MSPAERIARNERVIVVAAMILLGGLAWIWTAAAAETASPPAIKGMAMALPGLAVTFIMWWLRRQPSQMI